MPEIIGPDTARLALEQHYEAIQDRGDADDPPLPERLVRGAPGSVLDPLAVQPMAIVPDSSPTPAEQVGGVDDHVLAEQRKDHPEWDWD